MMFNWEEVLNHNPAVLTVVGMAKNAGKTVTLNYVQRTLHASGLTLGLTSIGRDGEEYDALTYLSKPAIRVQPGTLIATASKVVPESHTLERIERTGILTPLGEIELYRVQNEGQMILAGPSKNSEVKEIIGRLGNHGARCILIDGAFDRQSSTDPQISHHVILASGATLSRNLQQVVQITQARVEQLALPVCPDRDLLEKAQSIKTKVAWLSSGCLRERSGVTSLLTQDEWVQILDQGVSVLFIKGAVSNALGEALRRTNSPPRLLVLDGSKIFLNPELWKQLKAHNLLFEVIHPINLWAVTVNPMFPGGRGLDPEELLQALGQALAPLPVIDIVREKRFNE